MGTPLRLTAVRRMSKLLQEEVRVADAVARVVVGVEAGHRRKKDGDVLRPVPPFDLFPADVGHGHRSLAGLGAQPRDLDLGSEEGLRPEGERRRVREVGDVDFKRLKARRRYPDAKIGRRRVGEDETELSHRIRRRSKVESGRRSPRTSAPAMGRFGAGVRQLAAKLEAVAAVDNAAKKTVRKVF